jgi:23S rRNA pseudouridine1911/1915/1917 synthase
MPKPPIEVLWEDNHLLAVNKPAGLPTQGVAEGAPSLAKCAKEYLKRKYNKPGNVYLGIVSRLDAAVSGVVVFARTSKAAARLTEQFRNRRPEKLYWALVDRQPNQPAGELDHWLKKDERALKIRVVAPRSRGSQHAQLSYRVVAARNGQTLLEVRLHTGRKHQIRVQLSEIGCPICGDRKYGSNRPFPGGIALHAKELTIAHPITKEPVKIVAPLPPTWPALS